MTFSGWSGRATFLTPSAGLENRGVDVVLLDIGMPELEGYKTHLAITSVVGKTVPVVILTGDDSIASQAITKVQGASNYLIKQRTSPVELRRALYEAVVPVTTSKASSDGGSTIGETVSRLVTRMLRK
jgi:DNA-binding NarL/FixJ family response regulator